MNHPSIDKILNTIPSKFELVHVISRRSKEMESTKRYQLREVEYVSKKNIGKALEEVSEKLITVVK